MHARSGYTFSVRTLVLVVPLLCLLSVGIYFLPPVHDRLAWRIDALRARVKEIVSPSDQAIFIPQEQQTQIDSIVQATLQAFTATVLPPTDTPEAPTPSLEPAATLAATYTPLPSPTPTLTLTPRPRAVRLPGVKYEDQHNRWNYCGPANLSMALTFWGWAGDRDVVAAYVKPNPDAQEDRNVMPYEMVDFVASQTEYRALMRYGGELELLKKLVAAGFPVLAEKGYYEYDYTGKWGWMGHFQFVTGYDDNAGVLIVQDTYIKNGKDHEFPYADFQTGWRSFNYVFLVVYPPGREGELIALLGDWADPDWANRHALEIATAESQTLTGTDQYFAWFNRGTSHVNLFEYADAALAYDYAFNLYQDLSTEGDKPRPWRVMWYQTGPYWAYYYTGRYQDTIDLATYTLTQTISAPVLEESFYWRALAYLSRGASGDYDRALDDLRISLELHPGFAPALAQLQALGVSP